MGLRADLVLVRGNPRHDITVVRDIEGVWIAGVPVDRDRHARRVVAMNRFIALRDGNKPSEAAHVLADHLATDPLYDDGLYQLACAEALSGQPDRAIAHLRSAIARDPALAVSAAGEADLEALRTRDDFKALVSPVSR